MNSTNTANGKRESSSEAKKRIENLRFTKVSAKPEFFKGTLNSYADLWSHRQLLGRLFARDTKTRYKDSSLGIVWSLFKPILQLLIYFLIIGKVLGTARSVPDFAIFVFVGITIWTLHTEVLTRTVSSIIENSGLIKKVYFPREIFPISASLSAGLNFLIQFVVLVLAIIFLSTYHPEWQELPIAIAGIMMIFVLSTAIGIALSAINVYLRDTQHFIEIYIVIMFWCSPIVYPFGFVHKILNGNWLETLYLSNPVTIGILAGQRGLWWAGSSDTSQYWPPDLDLRLGICWIIALITLWLSQRIFVKLQGNFAQEI